MYVIRTERTTPTTVEVWVANPSTSEATPLILYYLRQGFRFVDSHAYSPRLERWTFSNEEDDR